MSINTGINTGINMDIVNRLHDKWLEPPELPFEGDNEVVAYCSNCGEPIHEDEFLYAVVNGEFYCSECCSCGLARRER